MKFGQRFSIRKGLEPIEFARGIWTPSMRLWRDVVEDYLYISRKRHRNKWSMYKLQLNILNDIVSNVDAIDQYSKLKQKFEDDHKKGDIKKEDLEKELRHIKSEILSYKILNKALKEIADGIVWRSFNFDRAILYILADKQPIDTIRLDTGTRNNLNEFSDVFLEHNSMAIYNDITNFLRIGDVTQIKGDGSIEFIEVKAGKKRGGRITRQKKRMSEVVELFNTGISDYDGKTIKIEESKIKQTNYLKLLRNAIKQAKNKGFATLLIGKYLIVQIVDFSKVTNSDKYIDYFDSKHKTIRDEWKKNSDIVSSTFFIDKMSYSKHCAPFSIYPFDIQTCTDIMMGRLDISLIFNYSELLRIIEKSGWNIKDALFLKTKDEIKALEGKDIDSVPYLVINNGTLTISVPPSMFSRMKYELLSPKAFLEMCQDSLNRGKQDVEYFLTRNTDEQKIWD